MTNDCTVEIYWETSYLLDKLKIIRGFESKTEAIERILKDIESYKAKRIRIFEDWKPNGISKVLDLNISCALDDVLCQVAASFNMGAGQALHYFVLLAYNDAISPRYRVVKNPDGTENTYYR